MRTLFPGETERQTEGTCEENHWGVEPFVVHRGCPRPAYCVATVEVIDAWSKPDQNNPKRKNYGFAAKITIPASFRDQNRASGYSILLRFPHTVTSQGFNILLFEKLTPFLGCIFFSVQDGGQGLTSYNFTPF